MTDNRAKEKYEKNARLVVGVNALHKIRGLVDKFEQQDNRNKKTAIVLSLLFAALLLFIVYVFISSHQNRKDDLQTSVNQSLNQYNMQTINRDLT